VGGSRDAPGGLKRYRYARLRQNREAHHEIGSRLSASWPCCRAPALGYAQGAQDFSKVEIKANKVTDKFYTLDGQGGTIGVLFGPDGVFMVDTQFAPLSDKIAAAVKQLTPQPIKFIVNTHVHGDHTGGDENFGKMGATIISREELRYRLAHPNPGANGQPGVPTARSAFRSRPIATADAAHERRGDPADRHPAAHTDGDTMVYFPGSTSS
jgi:glyoxylase-like metal-dependent hydrolase (beta-lactamase superfamily II)